jgi:hypothetical protein
LLVLALACAVPARAATPPREELLRLVPEDVGFCLVVNDLRGHTEKLLATPWLKKIRRSLFVKALIKSPEVKKLTGLDAQVRKYLGIGLAQLRDDILGDAVVLAYRPGPPEKPQREQGVILVWARDAKLLARVVKRLNRDLEKKPTALVHKKVTYFRRTDDQGDTVYYHLDGPLLTFSSQKAILREVIERKLAWAGRGKKEPAPLVGQLRRLGVERALAVLWFNPRSFDAHVRQTVDAASESEAVAYKTFWRYWRALEGAALAVSAGDTVAVKVAVRANPKKLPEAARRLFTQPSKPSALWDRFPPTALLAVAGRIDMVDFVRTVGELLPPAARLALKAGLKRGVEASLGLDVEKDILPYLGPDWGFCVTAPAERETLVPTCTWALRVRPGPKKVSVGKALYNALNSCAVLAVLTYNSGARSDELRLKTVMQGDVEVKYLVNGKLFPVGFQPAFALKDGYLVVATSPRAVKAFAKVKTAAVSGGEVPVLRVSLSGWAAFLNERREALTGFLAAKNGVSRSRAARHVQGLVWVLGLFDRLELTQKTGNGLAAWTLTLYPAKK